MNHQILKNILFAGICGITNEEINRYFAYGLQCLANAYNKSYDDIRKELKTRYDGYHFAENLLDIYNPFSLISVFASEKYGNYWFNSGTPSYLVALLKNSDWRLADINGYRIKVSRLGNEGIISKEVIPALYQAGYLTIKEYDSMFEEYVLGYPDKEVAEGFLEFLTPIYLGRQNSTEFSTRMFVTDVLHGEINSFMRRLDSLLRDVPHIGKSDPHEVFLQKCNIPCFQFDGVLLPCGRSYIQRTYRSYS